MTKFNRWAAAPRALVAITFVLALWGRWIWAADALNIDALIASLSSSSAPDFKKACQALGRMGPAAAKAVPVLSEIAEGKRKGGRKPAIQALSRIHTPDALPVLTRIAENPSQESRQAIIGLRQYNASAMPALLHLARDTGNAYDAVMALGQIGPDALPELEKLKTPRIDAGNLKDAITLARIQLPKGFEDVWRQATSPQDRSRLFTTYSALHARLLPQALDQLSSGDPELRRFASSVAFSCAVTLGIAEIPQESLEPEQDPEVLTRILTEHRAAIEAAARDSDKGVAENAKRLLAKLPAQATVTVAVKAPAPTPPANPKPAPTPAAAAPAAPRAPTEVVDNSPEGLAARLAKRPKFAEGQAICDQLGDMGPAANPAIPALTRMLNDGDNQTKGWATKAIEAIQTPETLPALKTIAIRVRSFGPDQYLMEAFEAIGKPALDTLVQLTVDKDAGKGAHNPYLFMIGAIGPDAIPALLKLRHDHAGDTLFVENVDNALITAKSQSPELLLQLVRPMNSQQRSITMGRVGDQGPRGLGAVVHAMRDRDPEIRRLAAGAAQKILHDGQSQSRRRSRGAPGASIHDILVAHAAEVKAAANDPELSVSSMAKRMIPYTVDTGSVARGGAASDPPVVTATTQPASAEARALVDALKNHPPSNLGNLTVSQIGKLPDADSAVPLLAELVSGQDVTTKMWGIKALGAIHSPATIAPLVKATGTADTVGTLALENLLLVGPPAIDALTALAESENYSAANGAIHALGMIGPQAAPVLDRLHLNHPGTHDRLASQIESAMVDCKAQSAKTLIELWTTRTGYARNQTIDPIARLKERSLGALIDVMGSRDPLMRKSAAECTQRMLQNLTSRPQRTTAQTAEVDAVRQVIQAHRLAVDNLAKNPEPQVALVSGLLLKYVGQSAPPPPPPSIVAGQVTPSQNDIDDLVGENERNRLDGYGRLLKLAYGRKIIVDKVGEQTNPGLVAFYRKHTSPALVPDAIDALTGFDSRSNWYAIVVIGSEFSDATQYDGTEQAKIRAAATKLNGIASTAPDPTDAVYALARLGKYGDTSVLQRITSGRPVERTAMTQALAINKRVLSDSYRAPLLKMAVDPDPKVRASAIVAFRAMTNPMESYDALYRLGDPKVRLNVIDGYAALIATPQAKAALEAAAKDPNPDIHVAAQTALNEPLIFAARGPVEKHPLDLPRPPATLLLPLATLTQALANPAMTSPGKARIAIEIGEYGDNAVAFASALGAIAGDASADHTLRGAAVEALGRIGPRAFRQLPAVGILEKSEDAALQQQARLARERIRIDDSPRNPQNLVSINAIKWPYDAKHPASVEDHLNFLIKAISLYRQDHDNAFPNSQADIDLYVIDPEPQVVELDPLDPFPAMDRMASMHPLGAMKAFINPRDRSNPGFYYIKPADTNGAPTPMVFEGMGGPLVAMTDGTVRKLDSNAFPPILRRTEANLYDLRNAISRYKFHHASKAPERLDQLREYFADDASWQRTITNPQTGESPGYGITAPSAKPWDRDELATIPMIYTTFKGVKDESAPAIYGDEHLR